MASLLKETIVGILLATAFLFSLITARADNDVFCTQEYDPVCGEDGRTYSNACRAEQEGVDVDYYGECDEDGDDDDDSGGGGCFIATAAFGTPLAEEVETLREFRDEYLMETDTGQAFVTFYYDHSPPIAAYLRDHGAAKEAVRKTLEHVVAGIDVLPGIGE